MPDIFYRCVCHWPDHVAILSVDQDVDDDWFQATLRIATPRRTTWERITYAIKVLLGTEPESYWIVLDETQCYDLGSRLREAAHRWAQRHRE